MNDIETEAVKNNKSQETAGKILHEERKKIGLSIDEVATKLNLEPKLIELLEKDEYEKFKFATYLKGYLRSYARFLNIDGDKVVNLYKEKNPEKKPNIVPDVKPKIQKNTNDKSVKLFSYIIGLSIALSILIWYQKNFLIQQNKKTIENVNTLPNIKNKINGVDISYKIITHSDYWQWPINEGYKENNDSNDLESVKDKETQNVIKEEQASIKEIVNATENTGYEIQEGGDTVVLDLTGDSWVEIYDRNGNRLFLDLARGGKNYIINGNSPFDILLGAAKGVSVEFNGESINTGPYIKYGIARFTLPIR